MTLPRLVIKRKRSSVQNQNIPSINLYHLISTIPNWSDSRRNIDHLLLVECGTGAYNIRVTGK
jgi:hypothetical protein